MVSQRLSNLPAVRRQHLLVEFASLKYACPHGIFMSLTPGDPTLWSGVLFVRKGPYAPSILRFQISFPPSYPSLPPLVTFSTDIFHPLLTPLTTYMYTTDTHTGAEGTVSATDEERLPPGGFSLRHGFPGWFGRRTRRSAERSTSAMQTPKKGDVHAESPSTGGSGSPTPGPAIGAKQAAVTTVEVLRYIRSTFDDEDVLDSVPLEAAGNPGAWHAWRSHRHKLGKVPAMVQKLEKSALLEGSDDGRKTPGDGGAPDGYQRLAGGTSAVPGARRPGEWNWEGVWEVRVKRGVDASVAEAALYGKDAGDDLIRFLHLDAEQVETVKENIRRSLAAVEPQRRGIV